MMLSQVLSGSRQSLIGWDSQRWLEESVKFGRAGEYRSYPSILQVSGRLTGDRRSPARRIRPRDRASTPPGRTLTYSSLSLVMASISS